MTAATLEIQALAQEWAEDREAMPEERREALLDHVRDRLDDMPRVLRSELGVPYTVDNVRAYAVVAIFSDLMMPIADTEALIESAVAPGESGPKETV